MKAIISLILFIALVLLYLIQGQSEEEQQQTTRDLKINYSQDDTNVKQLKNLNAYNAIVERPLFLEERQFEEEKKVKVVTRPKRVIEDLKVTALGIALTSDGILAVLKDLKNGKNLRLRIGDEIYGWRLDGVSESSFTFSKAGREKVIAFKG
jgi:Tfp pilus assembly protein PilO